MYPKTRSGGLLAAGLAVVFAVGWSGAALAQSHPLTLSEAVQLGVSQAPLLEAQDAGKSAAREDAVRAGRLPDPALTFGVTNFPVTAPGAFSFRSSVMTMRTVGVMQAIPSGAARRAEHALATANIDVANASRTWTEQSVRERIAEAWIDAWTAQERIRLLKALRDESELAVQVTTARLHGGAGNATDALAARAEREDLANRLDQAEARHQVAEASLQRWLPDREVADLAPPPDFALLPSSPARLVDHIDRLAPMRPWDARERTAQAELDRALASRHPNWNVSFTYGRRAPGLSDQVTLQVGVSLPLFTTNRQDRAVSARQEDRDAVAFAHEDARRAQREAVNRAVASWQGWQRQIARDEQTLLPLARDRARAALGAYRGGASLQAWLDARRDEIRLRLDYVDALAAHARTWASLAYLLPASETTP